MGGGGGGGGISKGGLYVKTLLITLLLKGGLDLKPTKLEHIFVAVITSPPPLSSVQIILIPACSLLCVL